MSDTLAVKISADVTSLQSSLAIAKAEMRAFGAQMNALARQAASKGLTADLQASINEASAQFQAASGRVNELSDSLDKAGGVASNFRERLSLTGKSLDEVRLRIADYTSLASGFGELLAVGFGGERILSLAENFGVLGDEIAKAMQATGMSAEDLSALRLAAQENDVEFANLTRAMTMFARGTEQAQQGSRQQLAAFESLGISAADLKAHGNDLSSMLELVSQRLSQYADGGNKAAIESAIFGGRIQGLAPILEDIGENGLAALKRHAEELGVTFNTDMTSEAREVNDSFIDLKAAAEGLATAIGVELAPAIAAANRGWTALLANMHQTDLVALESQMDGLHDTIEKLKEAQAKNPDAVVMGKPIQDMIDAAYAKYTDLSAKWQHLNDEMAHGGAGAGGAEGDNRPQAPGMAGMGDELQQFRAGLADLEANFTGTHAQLLASVAELWREEVTSGQLAETQLLQARTAAANAEKELTNATGQNAIASTREQISAVTAEENLGKVQQLQAEQQLWAQLLAGGRLNADQRIEVQRSYNDATAALQRAQQSEVQAIAKSDAAADLAISRLKLDAQKQILSEEASAHQITAQQEFDQLRAIAQQEEQLDEQVLQKRLVALRNEPAEYENVYNQIRQLRAKLAVDLAQMDKQEEVAAANAAKSEVTAWKGAVSEIESAENSLVSNILTKQQTLTQDLLQLSGQLVTKEISDDLKAVTTRLLLANTEAAQEKALSAGGVLYHMLAENQKTAATVTGNATRTASDATSQTTFLGGIAKMIAGWLGLETDKTAATIAGNAASNAAMIAGGMGQISIDAAVGAAGAEAFFAWMGPEVSVPAGIAEYAKIMGWAAGMGGGIASAAGGMLTVPSDMMAMIHQNESIIPANIANPMRDFFSGEGQQGGGDNITININALDTQTGTQFLKNNIGVIVSGLRTQMRNGSLQPA